MLTAATDRRLSPGFIVVARCACGARYDAHAWKCLPYVGVMDDGVERVELRNCSFDGCLSTIAIPLPPVPVTARQVVERKFAEAVEAGDVDSQPSAAVFAGLFLHLAGGDVGSALVICPLGPRAIWAAVRAMLGQIAIEEPHPLSLVGAVGGRR